jgi:hypothetical protein
VLVKAPSSTAVVITNVEIKILRYHEWDSTGSLIQCGYGADAYGASTATFSFAKNDSTLHLSRLTEAGDTADFTIPPDQFRVDAGLTEVIALHPEGRPGFYEWSITVHAIIDQKQVVDRLGTDDAPLLTAIIPEGQSDRLKTVDWDLASCRWGKPPTIPSSSRTIRVGGPATDPGLGVCDGRSRWDRDGVLMGSGQRPSLDLPLSQEGSARSARTGSIASTAQHALRLYTMLGL